MLLIAGPGYSVAEPSTAAVSGFDMYVRGVEQRLVEQHRNGSGFLVPVAAAQGEARLKRGELIVEQVAGRDLPGAMLHHWRGTAFLPGMTATEFERLMEDFDSYPQHFAPEVVQAKMLVQQDGHVQAWMRVRQKHVLTVVMDTTYDVTFSRLDAGHGYSASRSTRIAEIASPGTASEHVLSGANEHGFLWRLNSYWSYEERDGGLYVQIESVSLSRAIPTGLGWALRPYVESVPRESLEFTLQSACNALRRQPAKRSNIQGGEK